MRTNGRQTAPDVFAARLGRVDILSGGFARLVFLTIDNTIIEPTIVVPLDAVSSAILDMTKAAAVATLGLGERVYN